MLYLVWSNNSYAPFLLRLRRILLPSCLLLSLLLSYIRVCLAIGSHVADLCGQQGSNRLKKLLGLPERHVGCRVTDMGRATIISDTPQIGQRTEDTAHVHRQASCPDIVSFEEGHHTAVAAKRFPLCQEQSRRGVEGRI